MSKMILKDGIVKWYDTKKGFGFILNEEEADVFFHHTALPGNEFKNTVFEGDAVVYEELTKEDGKLHTTNIISVERSV